MEAEKENIIVDLTFRFSLKIIAFSESLEEKRKYNMANQLFRSGTSIGANVREAQGCESKADFIHKMKLLIKRQRKPSTVLLFASNPQAIPMLIT